MGLGRTYKYVSHGYIASSPTGARTHLASRGFPEVSANTSTTSPSTHDFFCPVEGILRE